MAKDTLLNNSDTSFDKLLQEQAAPTEEKQPQALLQPVIDEDEDVEEAVDIQKRIETKQPEKETPIFTAETIANETNMAMAFIDFGQQTAFNYVINHKRKKKLAKVLGENPIEKVEILQAKPTDELTDVEKLALKIETQVQDVIASLPFTNEEKEIFKPILENYIKNNRGQLPENFFVYIGILQAFGGRILNTIML